MVARNRLPPWHQELRLNNGRLVLIRPIRPDDAPPLRAAFDLLQPEQMRQRLLQPAKEASAEFIERLCHPDPHTEFVLVAAEPYPVGEAMVQAIARTAVVPSTRSGEFTILLGKHITEMGLGRQLMQRLVRWARGKRLEQLYGDVLADNTPMLDLAKTLGFERAAEAHDGLTRLVLDLRRPKTAVVAAAASSAHSMHHLI